MSKLLRMAVFVCALIGVVACDGDDPDKTPHLLSDPNQPSEDSERQRLRELQTLKTVWTYPDGTEVEQPYYIGDYASANNYLENGFIMSLACQTRLGWTSGPPSYTPTTFAFDSCATELRTAVVELCVANQLLELASLRKKAINLAEGIQGTGPAVLVGSQTSATNAALARYASTRARKAFFNYAKMLEYATGHDPDKPCVATKLGDPFPLTGSTKTVAEFIGAGFADAYSTFRETIDVYARNTVAAADAQYSSTASLQLGESRAITGTELSRAAAAHAFIGGDPGLAGSTTIAGTNWCAVPEATPSVKAAIEIFREAGVDPNDILRTEADLSTATLLESVTDCPSAACTSTQANSAPPNFSVRERLAHRWRQETRLLSTTTPNLYDSFNLSAADFKAAREYLASEIKAYSRSLTAVLPAQTRPGNLLTLVPLFAATARVPPTRPPAYFADAAKLTPLMRYVAPRAADTSPFTEGMPYQNSTDPYTNHLSEFVDNAMTIGQLELARFTSVPSAQRGALLDPIATLVADGDRERIGRLLIDSPSTNVFRFTAYGLGNVDQAKIIKGQDGLDCAVNGSVEGAPCNLTTYTVASLGSETIVPPFMRVVSVGNTTITNPSTTPYYLIRKRPTATSAAVYEAVVGFRLRAVGLYTESYPIVPEAERRAAELLMPGRDWCARPQVSCAGYEMDARIPLEDELSDDGNGVENSWKHYVELARQAATESDALGEAILAGGEGVASQEVSIAARAEGALEELQQICGTDIDIQKLRSLIGTSVGGLDKMRTQQTCTSDASCDFLETGGLNYQCSNGVCVGDVVQAVANGAAFFPELQRLANCMDAGQVVDFVTPGSQDLCVWVKGGNSSLLCADATPAKRCPVVANPWVAGVAGCAHLDLPSTILSSDVRRVTTKLGYFDYANGAAGLPRANTCDPIRSLRNSRPNDTVLSELIASNYFHPGNFAPLALRVGYEPRFGSHSAVTLDGAPIFQTGDTWTPPSQKWPCQAYSTATCPAPSTKSLFCQVADCTTVTGRRSMNRRLHNAVIALRGMVTPDNVGDFKGVLFPGFGSYDATQAESVNKFFRPRTGQAPVEVHEVKYKDNPRTFRFHYVNSTNPAEKIAWSDLVDTTSGTFQDYSADGVTGLGFAVVEGIPNQCLDAQSHPVDCYPNWFNRLSSAERGQMGASRGGIGWFQYYLIENHDVASRDLPYSWSIGGGYSNTVSITAFRPEFSPTDLPTGVSLTSFGLRYLPNTNQTEVAMDALELGCELGQASSQTSTCNLANAPNIALEGWTAAKRYLDCAAAEIERQGVLTIYANFPSRALDALRRESSAGAYPALGGSYGTAVSRLRSSVVDVSEVTGLIGSELRTLGNDLEQLETSVALAGVRQQMSEVQYQAETANQMASCFASTIGGATIDPIGGAANALSAAVTCANSFAQTKFAARIRDLEVTETNLLAEQSRIEFQQRFETHATNLQSYGSRLTKASSDIDAALSELETMRNRARQVLARALVDTSTVAKKQAELLSVAQARFGTAQRRYEGSRANAVRMAFLAKRAVEVRLGVRLASLKEDLPLVPAPSTWENSVCEASGVDYANVVREGGAKDYADAYIGDYVTKLENVVESYRLVNNFHEGTDTAVVSLRDDFHRVKRECTTEVNNLLLFASDLPQAGFFPGTKSSPALLPLGRWVLTDCLADPVNPSLGRPDCVAISALGEDTTPFAPAVREASSPQAYRVVYGGTGYVAGATIAQRVDLSPGRYRLSWYTRQVGGGHTGAGIGVLWGPQAVMVGSEGSEDVDPRPPAIQPRWFRRWRIYDVGQQGAYDVAIGPNLTSTIDLAAPMLESGSGLSAADLPSEFMNTGATTTRFLASCPDTDGDVFRATRWRRGCVQLCANGFNSSCANEAAQTYCYRETLVSFTQGDIDGGRVFGASGLARGNFNYRIERIGVNFVGTGLRSCEDAEAPSSCYGSGYLTYSLEHGGPYHVRNYAGQDVEVQLFKGNIEHARGLAAERYLTNPLSSADESLIDSYLRNEFQGRPLDGTFVLRVWEEPSLNFDALEDVQLALTYRYWTRFK